LSEQAAIGTGSGNPPVNSPADPSIAVGASYVVEAANSALEIFTRAGAPVLPLLNINAMIKNTSGWGVSHPQVVYDPMSGLYILMVLQYNPTLSACGSQIAVMVSQSNPSLAWTSRGTISVDPALTNVELSSVSLGLTSGVVAESSDYKSCSTGAPVASQSVIIRRADLVTGGFTTNTYAFIEPGPVGLQPAMAVLAQSYEYEVANDASCATRAIVLGSIAVFSIAGLPTGGVVSWTCTTESEPTATSAPPAAAQGGGTAATLMTGSDRFLSAVWEGSTLWAAGNTGCVLDTLSCINVVSIAASSGGSVTGATQLTPEGLSGASLYDPAIALDSAGDAILTFDESSSTAFESVMVAGITGGTWSTPIPLHTSLTFYSPGGCSRCTWGDYSAAVQDPTHPTDVWVLSEETDGNTGTSCAANACWNTVVGRYTVAGPTISSLSPAAGPASGGELVTVTGSDFAQDSTFTLNTASVAIAAGTLTADSFTFTTPSGASGLVQAQVHDSLGYSPMGVGSGYMYVGLANYVPLSPFRILDTRPGNCVQCSTNPTFGPGATEKVQLTGVTGLSVNPDPIPTTATAVVLNVTEVAGTAGSLLTVYPFGIGMPQASNLNFAPGKVIANLVTVTLGEGGAVNIYNALGSVNLLADVEGYFGPAPSNPNQGLFHPITPIRVCDTRTSCGGNGAVGAGKSIVVTVATTGGIPSDGTAGAAVVNLTGVAGSASTYLSLFPTDVNGHCNPTGTSTINLLPGAVAANRVMVKLGPTSTGTPADALCVYNAVGSINVIVDTNGWYGGLSAPASPVGYQYQAVAPTRICDTRSVSTSCTPVAAIGAGTTLQRLITVSGKAGVPAFGSSTKVVAIIANLTGIAPTTATYLEVYPANLSSPPRVSDLNLGVGAVVPNLAVVEVDTTPSDAHDGDVWLYNAAGSVNAILDLEGWFQ
jgi:IPT/TIG domain